MNIIKNRMTKVLAFVAVVFSANSFADVKLTFVEGKKFTDYEYSDESRPRSLIRLEKELNELFTELAKPALKEKQTLEIDVTNVDLPGIIRYGYGNGRNLRVVNSNTPYRIYFDYRLKDANGVILKEGKKETKEFSDFGIASRRNQSKGVVRYYEKPLETWLEEILSK